MNHVNEIVFAGEHFKIGRWRLPATHPHFRNSGPTRNYLLVFPRTSTWIQHAGSEAFPSDANNVTFYNQHQEYTRQPISAEGDHCDYYAMTPALVRQIVAVWDPRAADEESHIIRFAHGPSDANAYLMQRRVYRHVRETAAADALFVEETMMRVFARLFGLAYGVSPRPAARHRDLVHHAREFIARRYWKNVTIGALAEATGTSAFHLCRIFREQTGLTIHVYRNQLRLRAALERVLDQRSELTDVALGLGYSSHSHFTAAFRRQYGCTPSEARRAYLTLNQRAPRPGCR